MKKNLRSGLSLLLALMLLLTAVPISASALTAPTAITASPQTVLPGDINKDNKLNNKDVSRLMQYLAGWKVEVNEDLLDVNGDKKINNKDVSRLMQYLAGWAVEIFPKPSTEETTIPEPSTEEPEPTTAKPEPTTAEPEPPTDMPEPSTAEPPVVDENVTVAGNKADIFGMAWLSGLPENAMTRCADGTYIKVYENVGPAEDVALKVVDNDNWIGNLTGDNITFNLTEETTLTVKYDPNAVDTSMVTVSGAGVEFHQVNASTVKKMVAVGGGSDSNFLNGENWNVSSDANEMSEISDGVYEILYEDVEAGEYQFKFAANDNWTDNWGSENYHNNLPGTYPAAYNGDNICFEVAEDSSSVKLRIDISQFDYFSGKYDATYTIIVIGPDDEETTVAEPSTVKPEPSTEEPEPTTAEPTVNPENSLKVNAKSNILPMASKTFDEDADTITVTWWVQSPKQLMINIQAVLTYDDTKLTVDPEKNRIIDDDYSCDGILRVYSKSYNCFGHNIVTNFTPSSWNLPADGNNNGIRFNASDIYGYYMYQGNGDKTPLISVTFDKAAFADGETDVNLYVETMCYKDGDNYPYLVKNREIADHDFQYVPADTPTEIYEGPYNKTFVVPGTQPTTATPVVNGDVYVLTGGSDWLDGWEPEPDKNVMTKNENGVYSITVPDVAASDYIYNLKVVRFADLGGYYGDPEWIGSFGSIYNYDFKVTSACDVTVTYDPATGEIKATGSGVIIPSYPIDKVTAVGNGQCGFLNDYYWDPTAEVNDMTEISPRVYRITYKAVEANNEYSVKFAANGNWEMNWGEDSLYYQGDCVQLGVSHKAIFNGNNIIFCPESDQDYVDVTLTLDLSTWDSTTMEGAYYTISCVDSEQPITIAPTVPESTVEVSTTEQPTTAEPESLFEKITAVGTGVGSFLNGIVWDPTAEENDMTEIAPNVYQITYDAVTANVRYQVKFTANGSWDINWGGYGTDYSGDGDPVVFNEPHPAYTGGSNIIIYPVSENDYVEVTLTLDLTNYDPDYQTGAVYTVSVPENDEEITTEPEVPTIEAPTTENPTEPEVPTIEAPTTEKPTEPEVPTIEAPTTVSTPVDRKLKVTANSNIMPSVSQTFDEDTDTITVTWWVQSPLQMMINVQATLTYDGTKLTVDPDKNKKDNGKNESLVLRITDSYHTVVNYEPRTLPNDGNNKGIKFNASDLAGYKMYQGNGEKTPFVSVTFDKAASAAGETDVNLYVEIMSYKVGNDDPYLFYNSELADPDFQYIPAECPCAVYAGPFNADYNQSEEPTTAEPIPTESEDKFVVKFSNNQKWEQVYVYAWTSNTSLTDWPGIPMKSIGVNDYGEEVFEASVPASAEGICFTAGAEGPQTVDIYDLNYEGYYTDGTMTNDKFNALPWEVEPTTVKPTELEEPVTEEPPTVKPTELEEPVTEEPPTVKPTELEEPTTEEPTELICNCEALGIPHQYEVISSKEPTATEDGYKTYKCKLCYDTYTEILPAVPAEEDIYVITGGSDWLDGWLPAVYSDYVMTKQEDGTYAITVTEVSAGTSYYSLKVVKFAGGDESKKEWIGVNGTDYNCDFMQKADGDVTVTFNPDTKEIKVTGDGVAPAEYPIDKMTAVGSGQGGFLYDISWDPDAADNMMDEVSEGVYEIVFYEVDANVEYQVKFAANGGWGMNWGYEPDTDITFGTPVAAQYNANDNIVFTPWSDNEYVNITLTLDLTNWNKVTKEGATYTITVEEIIELGPEPENETFAVDVVSNFFNDASFVIGKTEAIPDTVDASQYVYYDGEGDPEQVVLEFYVDTDAYQIINGQYDLYYDTDVLAFREASNKNGNILNVCPAAGSYYTQCNFNAGDGMAKFNFSNANGCNLTDENGDPIPVVRLVFDVVGEGDASVNLSVYKQTFKDYGVVTDPDTWYIYSRDDNNGESIKEMLIENGARLYVTAKA